MLHTGKWSIYKSDASGRWWASWDGTLTSPSFSTNTFEETRRKMITLTELSAQIQDAIKQFGVWNVGDKPGECIDTLYIKSRLARMSSSEVGMLLSEVLHHEVGVGSEIVGVILSAIDDRSDFGEILVMDPRLGKLY